MDKKTIKAILSFVSSWMTLQEAAAYLRVHPNTLRNWDNNGTLKAERIGKRHDRRFKKDDVKKFIEEGRHH